jgi:hypothetical protein
MRGRVREVIDWAPQATTWRAASPFRRGWSGGQLSDEGQEMMCIQRHLALLALVSLVRCSQTTEITGTGRGVEQEVPPPCDIPGLSQEQYRTCVAHTFCQVFTLKKITTGERKPDDPRNDADYKQCVRDRSFDPGSGFYWMVRP